MRVAFAGGGTGGHIVPGLHLVERLTSKPGESEAGTPGFEDLLWFTSGRAVEDRILSAFEAPCPWERVILELEPRGGGAPSKLRLSLGLPQSVMAARRALQSHGSQVLLGLGGFTALPVALAARSLGLPVAMLEINAVRGKATRALAPLVQRVFHAWESSLPSSGVDERHRLMGAPVSPSVTRIGLDGGDRERAARELGFDPQRPLLVVLGGSQGAGSLNEYVSRHAEGWLADGLQILHQCGPGRRGEAPEDAEGMRVVEYLTPVAPGLEAATLLLCRGGASTLAEVAASRRPAVVVPYPHHADRHQEQNARQLRAGVEIVQEEDLDDAFAKKLVALTSAQGAERRARMSRALAEVAPVDAARAILQELAGLTLAGLR